MLMIENGGLIREQIELRRCVPVLQSFFSAFAGHRSWNYSSPAMSSPSAGALGYGNNHYYVPQSNSNPYLAGSSTSSFPGASVSSTSSLAASNTFQCESLRSILSVLKSELYSLSYLFHCSLS